MELYLRWLEKYEMQKDEDPPVGLILCADKNEEHIQLLRLDETGIRVARYLTQLPPKHQGIQFLQLLILVFQQPPLKFIEGRKFENRSDRKAEYGGRQNF